MRKSEFWMPTPLDNEWLQCGRIYKDAEIRFCVRGRRILVIKLQCGRIYKDAEILSRGSSCTACLLRFNVAASIKMRKSSTSAPAPTGERSGFNVAASIKMRKCCKRSLQVEDKHGLQCGRIYKDAEMAQRRAGAARRNRRFNVAASIKMRKFL